jgi:uncharacterized protein (UPF0332 family)
MAAASHWRVSKARRFVAAAQDAFRQGHWETVASRAYYAAYHSVAALLETSSQVSRRPWRHETLLRDFRDQFANRGYLFTRRDGNSLAKLVQERYAADYEHVIFNERRAGRVLRDAEDLCSRVFEVVKDA